MECTHARYFFGVQDNSITVKNSPARNLHRLLNTLAFISAIFKGLHSGKALKDAVSGAGWGLVGFRA